MAIKKLGARSKLRRKGWTLKNKGLGRTTTKCKAKALPLIRSRQPQHIQGLKALGISPKNWEFSLQRASAKWLVSDNNSKS